MKRWLNICSVHFRMQIFGTEGDDYSPGLALWWSDLAVLGGLMIGYICTSFSPSSECMFESSFTAVTIIFLSLWLSLFISLLREVLEVHEFRGVWKRVVMTGRKAEVVESRVWSLSPPISWVNPLFAVICRECWEVWWFFLGLPLAHLLGTGWPTL